MNGIADTQESSVVDEFSGIDPDDVMALISGASQEVSLPAEQGAGEEIKAPTGVTMSPEDIQAMIREGISEGISKGTRNQPQQQGQANDPNKFYTDYESSLKKSYADKHGLNEEGATFMAATAMESIKPLVHMMAQGFNNMRQADNDIVTQNTLQDVEKSMTSWLQEKNITDPVLRGDITKLAKINTAEIPNADMNTLRAEFEKVTSRYLKESVNSDEDILSNAQTTRRGLPPVVNSGKIGFDDIVQRVAKSSAKEDDIGGSRMLALAERMISSGGA